MLSNHNVLADIEEDINGPSMKQCENPSQHSVSFSKQKLHLSHLSYALSWKPCQGDSLNLPDHRERTNYGIGWYLPAHNLAAKAQCGWRENLLGCCDGVWLPAKDNFSFTERLVAKYGGPAAMYFVSKKLKKRHNVTDERKALYEAAETWVDALKGRQYLGGSEPNLGDLAVFGVLRPIRPNIRKRYGREYTQLASGSLEWKAK
ncbi:prostaglandin E synthase 2 [Tanacetum coccineum]